MSITVVRPTSSMARREYSAGELANSLYRPKFIIGAASNPAPAVAAERSKSRRDILLVLLIIIGRKTYQLRYTLEIRIGKRPVLALSNSGGASFDLNPVCSYRNPSSFYYSAVKCNIFLHQLSCDVNETHQLLQYLRTFLALERKYSAFKQHST